MNNTKRLPDAYRKDIGGNLYNLMQLANLLDTDLKSDYACIDNSRDLENATGKTLDYYGNMIGASRNGLNDSKYRIKIRNRIGVMTSKSDNYSVRNAIAKMMNVDVSEIGIMENEGSVAITGLSIEMLENSGFSNKEFEEMITNLIPVGIGIARQVYKGSLLMSHEYQANSEFPVLKPAWIMGQKAYHESGKDIGLKGYCEVPESFNDGIETPYPLTGTYEGGTLGVFSEKIGG